MRLARLVAEAIPHLKLSTNIITSWICRCGREGLRLALATECVALAIGAFIVGPGLILIARATGLG